MKKELCLNKKKLLHLKESQMIALLGAQEQGQEVEETSSKRRFCSHEEPDPLIGYGLF